MEPIEGVSEFAEAYAALTFPPKLKMSIPFRAGVLFTPSPSPDVNAVVKSSTVLSSSIIEPADFCAVEGWEEWAEGFERGVERSWPMPMPTCSSFRPPVGSESATRTAEVDASG
ncbi:hypothetical protein [Streptomyces sp. 3N207]|uniref:hypothetical protein n=1 Tax=Streptomyces sp. 3N207 TaxID=3457417 RepID=UPI003FCF212E